MHLKASLLALVAGTIGCAAIAGSNAGAEPLRIAAAFHVDVGLAEQDA